MEDGTEKATWNVDEGTVTVLIPKMNKLEHFTSLDMLSKLLMRKSENIAAKQKSPLIEEIDDRENALSVENGEDDETDWEIEQHFPTSIDLLNGGKYGFDLGFSGVFADLPQDFCYEIFEIKCNPETLSLADRQQMRFSLEKEKFDIEHYLYDFVDEEQQINSLMKPKHWYNKCTATAECVDGITKGVEEISIAQNQSSDGAQKNTDFYSERQQQELLSLKPKQKYLISHKNIVYAGLLELALAYCYIYRAFDGDLNPEVPWTVTILCPMLGNLESSESVEVIVKNFITRSLCYPLYRSWQFALKICKDAIDLMKGGKACILKALLDLKICFEKDESRYIFSKIFFADYCGWIQTDSCNESHLNTIIADADYVLSVVTKSFVEIVDLELVESILSETED